MRPDQVNQTRRKQSRKSGWILIALAVLMLICLVSVGSAVGFGQIKNIVIKDFGEPSNRLSQRQLVLYTLKLYLSRTTLLSPSRPDGLPVSFMVQLDENLPSIANRLESSGVIRDAGSFINFLVYSGLDSSIQAGEYEFNPSDTPLDIALQMQDATPGEIPFTILAGWRMEEVAQALEEYGILDNQEEFLQLAAHPDNLPLPDNWPEDLGIEGLLFPGKYLIPREASPGEILALFLDRFKDEVGPALISRIEQRGLSLLQAVTLASIVEKEAVRVDEQPVIASVFYNRLNNRMNLETDPTVQYAIGYWQPSRSWWKNPLTAADLDVISPYNTYKNNGLPPAPICNPGLSALNAVATAPESKYFFFRARCDGSGYHNFSQTFEEHLLKSCSE